VFSILYSGPIARTSLLQFTVVAGNATPSGDAAAVEETTIAKLTASGRALSKPIRVGMLNLLVAATVEGRGCCGLPDLGVPADAEETGLGFRMGQSKVFYHLRKLKEAGLVREEKRGKWSFYSLDWEAVTELIKELTGQLGIRCVDHEDMENQKRATVLFLCTHNSARSQMAEGLLRHLGGETYNTYSLPEPRRPVSRRKRYE
jgi:ArsR family transcriptional regulator